MISFLLYKLKCRQMHTFLCIKKTSQIIDTYSDADKSFVSLGDLKGNFSSLALNPWNKAVL